MWQPWRHLHGLTLAVWNETHTQTSHLIDADTTQDNWGNTPTACWDLTDLMSCIASSCHNFKTLTMAVEALSESPVYQDQKEKEVHTCTLYCRRPQDSLPRNYWSIKSAEPIHQKAIVKAIIYHGQTLFWVKKEEEKHSSFHPLLPTDCHGDPSRSCRQHLLNSLNDTAREI